MMTSQVGEHVGVLGAYDALRPFPRIHPYASLPFVSPEVYPV